MIWCCYFCKKIVFCVGLGSWGPHFCTSQVKNNNFYRFQHVFRTTVFQLKLLILIESLYIFHWKAAKNQSGCDLGPKFEPNQVQCCKIMDIINRVFFHILHGEYVPKQKVVVVQTSEWKFRSSIARSVTFEGWQGQIFV